MGRYEKTAVPFALPGHCFLCRNHENKEGFIDTRLHIDYEDGQPFNGAVYICFSCVAELGHMFGFLTPVEATKLQKRVDQLEHREYDLIERQGNLENVIDALSKLKSDNPDVSNVLSLMDENVDEKPEPAEPEFDRPPEEPESTEPESDERTSESDSEQRLGDLFESSSSVSLGL